MKILKVIPYFNPKRGGELNICANLSRQLAKNGHDVTILTTDFEFDPGFAASLPGIEVIPFRCTANISFFLYSPGMKRWLAKHLREYDVVHLHTFRAYQNNLIAACARRAGVPYIVQAHGSVSRDLQKKYLKQVYDAAWGNALLAGSARVIALNPTEASQYREMGVSNGKIVIVPNGIDPAEYRPLPEPGMFRRMLGIGPEERIVLYLGRLDHTKGIDLLVEAFADTPGIRDGSRLVLVGPDFGYRDELTGLCRSRGIEDRVVFTGFVTDEEKRAALVDADVFVTPKFTGFPVTFLEASLCETPIVTTRHKDGLDWIDGRCGYVVAYDPQSLGDAMARILGDEGRRKTFGAAGKQWTTEHYTWESVVREIETVYDTVTGMVGS